MISTTVERNKRKPIGVFVVCFDVLLFLYSLLDVLVFCTVCLMWHCSVASPNQKRLPRNIIIYTLSKTFCVKFRQRRLW